MTVKLKINKNVMFEYYRFHLESTICTEIYTKLSLIVKLFQLVNTETAERKISSQRRLHFSVREIRR